MPNSASRISATSSDPPSERRPDLVERDAQERPYPAEPEPASDVLEARVRGAERRSDRQVDERVAPSDITSTEPQ